MINSTWLHTFITLVETSHFTKTAEKLFMTQPGVSQHIKKLEQELGLELIKRIGKGFELTPQGEELYKYGKEISQREKVLLEKFEIDDPYSGECKISCSGSIATLLYPRFLEMQIKHPNLHFKLVASPRQSIIKSVLENESDIGIISEEPSSALLDSKYVGQDTLQLVLPNSFKKKTITIDMLNKLGFINHPNGNEYASKVLASNWPKEFQENFSFNQSGFVNQLSQILLPVSLGLGFTILPRSTVTQSEYLVSLKTIPLKKEVTEDIYLIKKRNRPLSSRYQTIEEAITKELGK